MCDSVLQKTIYMWKLFLEIVWCFACFFSKLSKLPKYKLIHAGNMMVVSHSLKFSINWKTPMCLIQHADFVKIVRNAHKEQRIRTTSALLGIVTGMGGLHSYNSYLGPGQCQDRETRIS